MVAFQRLAHDLGVAYAFERIIGPAVGQFDNVIDHIVDIFGVDEMRHAELARQRLALGVEVDPDDFVGAHHLGALDDRSEEHTSELQSLMRISYAVFCLKKQTTNLFQISTIITKTQITRTASTT